MRIKIDNTGFQTKRFGVHFDHPWSEDVKENGAPIRLHVRSPWGFLMIGEKSQVYDRKTKKYTDRWAYITRRPPQKKVYDCYWRQCE